MKLLLDDKQHHGCYLNANEACIFAAILKCTRAGRGWYGNYRELAAAMPFVMSHETARRAVQKLLNLGLIERREEKLFAVTQIVTDDAQNVTDPTQNVTSDAQNVLPPNNPPIINNMNENQLSSPAQDARAEEKKTEENLDFMDFWFLFSAPKEMLNRENACRRRLPKSEIRSFISTITTNPSPSSYAETKPATSSKSATTVLTSFAPVPLWSFSDLNGSAIGN